MPQGPSQAPAPTDLHDDQVAALLRSGAHAALLSAYFGEFEYRELCHLAKLAATRRKPRGPLVFVLPGIMGSRLGSVRNKATQLLWLHPSAIASGGLMQLALPAARKLRALGVMLPGYLKLKLSLQIAGYTPIFHPFDWRGDLDRLSRALIQAIENTGARKVMIVGHSMGGLVARAALAHDKHKRIAKLVQLGAPNFGSFAPVQALRAVYPTVRKIASLDQRHSAEELATTVFRTLPGLYQLLPSAQDHDQLDLFDARSWPQDELIPDPALLSRARTVRSRLPPPDDRCYAIAGVDQETIISVTVRDGGFEYSSSRDGDGTVPLSRASWPGARMWFASENHGGLTNNSTVLSAVADLLKKGDTQRLTTQRPAAAAAISRRITDRELRIEATRKTQWESLSIDSRRRILEPVISPEFKTP